MNTPIRAAYYSALLADASYVEGLAARDTGLRLEDALEKRLSRPLAKSIGAEFTVVTQFTDPRGSGFSVTVFADSSGTQYISFRGTDSLLSDLLPDMDAYFRSGLARSQVVAMVNWYLRASTPANMQAVQVLERPAVDQLTGEVLARTTLAPGEGTLPVAGNYVVNGHSLGGHLATVFSRLFNERVLSSHTYNGLGVGRRFPEGLIGEIEAALALGATSWTAVDAKQKNYYAQHGISVATTDWWLAQRGERIALFNEAGGAVANHLMYKLTDALALYDVLGALDGGLSIADASAIANAASANAPASLESVLDALRRLYRTADQTAARIGDAAGNVPSRADFHAKVAELRTAIGASPWTTVRSLVEMSTSELTARANIANGLAYRYALKELNPFAVLGPDALYAAHNQNGALDLFVDASSTPAGMTTAYLGDRARMLAFLVTANTRDTDVLVSNQVNNQVLYRDLVPRPAAGSAQARPTELNVVPRGIMPDPHSPNTRIVEFGTDGADALQGRNNIDRFYGGGGNDELKGGGGDDYLEGGAGIDTLEGGADNDTLVGGAGDDLLIGGEGVDTYVINSGDGADRIVDSDRNRILHNGKLVAGVFVKDAASGKHRFLGDDRWTMEFGSPGVLTLDENTSLTFDDYTSAAAFAEGDFGIRLLDTRNAPQSPVRTFLGDKQNYDSNPATPGEIEPVDDGFGNYVRADGQDGRPDVPLVDRVDEFRGSAADEVERFVAGGGNDIVYADGASLASRVYLPGEASYQVHSWYGDNVISINRGTGDPRHPITDAIGIVALDATQHQIRHAAPRFQCSGRAGA